jgi:hypothetical protein
MSFDQVTTIGGQTTTGSMATKNGKVRTEATVMGQQMTILVDPGQKTAYMWTSGSNQAMKLSLEQYEAQSGNAPDPADLSASIAQGRLVGTETVDGQPCDVYESVEGTTTVKTWVAKSNGFPVKSEVTTPQGVIKSEFKNVKVGGVPDSLFELPAGMEIVDMGNIPGFSGGGVPGGPGGGMPPIPSVPVPGR